MQNKICFCFTAGDFFATDEFRIHRNTTYSASSSSDWLRQSGNSTERISRIRRVNAVEINVLGLLTADNLNINASRTGDSRHARIIARVRRQRRVDTQRRGERVRPFGIDGNSRSVVIFRLNRVFVAVPKYRTQIVRSLTNGAGQHYRAARLHVHIRRSEYFRFRLCESENEAARY